MHPNAELKLIQRSIRVREGTEEVRPKSSPSLFSRSFDPPSDVFQNPLGKPDNRQALTCDTVRLLPIRKLPR